MNYSMNTLKAFGIVLVVCGHLGETIFTWFHPYSFHMSLFVFVSGYFYKNIYDNNIFTYIGKKFKKLVIPYYGWNLFYGVIVTILLKSDIIQFGQEITLRNFIVEPWMSGHQYFFNLAGWFVLSLFLTIALYCLCRKITKVIFKSEYSLLVIFIMLSGAVVYLSLEGYVNNVNLPILRAIFALPFFHLGFLYKEKIECKDNFNSIAFLILLTIQSFVIYKTHNSFTYAMVWMDFYEKKMPLIPLIVSISGTYLFLHIAKIVTIYNKGNDKLLNLIGNSTWAIMLHHLFGIWLVNVIFYKLHLWGVRKFESFDVIQYKTQGYYQYICFGEFSYIVYLIAAIAISIFIDICAKYVRKQFFEKITLFKIKA